MDQVILSHKTEKTAPISFRLPASMKKLLADKGAEYGLSPGEFARRIVLESLKDDFDTKLLAELARIFREVQAGRDDLATVAKVLMVIVGNQTVDDAEAWINDNLRNED